ncbi:MAG: cobalamin-dependent protein, partial [Pseudomonadota bacterium]
MKVALVIPPSWSIQTPPLGIASTAGLLKREGYDIQVFDKNIELFNQTARDSVNYWCFSQFRRWTEVDQFDGDTLPLLQDVFDQSVDDILMTQPEVIGFSLYDTSFLTAVYFAKKIREKAPKMKIVFGGPGASETNFKVYFERLEGLVDVAVIGEGEGTLVEVMERLKNKKSMKGCLGVAYEGQGAFVFEPIRPNLQLDSLPLPFFGDFDFDDYETKSLPVMMSRGCVAKCTFCSETRYWKKYRYRSADHIFSELKYDGDTYRR